MKGHWLLIPALAALFVSPRAIAQECINCWINPSTGQVENLERLNQQNGALQTSIVLVYGRQNCGWTKKMMEQLAEKKIPYQFKDINNNRNREMMGRLLVNARITSRTIPLPVLYVNELVMLRPTIEEVMAQL